jgi:hypothetical protein
VLASVAVMLAGCGGSSSSPGVAHLSSTAPGGGDPSAGAGSSSEGGAPTQQQLVAFSQCMRSHGVAEFPEPSGGRLLIAVGGHGAHRTGLDPHSAQFQSARKACAKLLPNGGAPTPAEVAKLREASLEFSACVRAHGLPNFPDPTFTGNAVQLKGVGGAAGIDFTSPQFKAAQKACQSVGPRVPGAKGGPAEGPNIGIGSPKGQ